MNSSGSGSDLRKYTFRIPQWAPPSINEVIGRHHSVLDKLKKMTSDLLGVYAFQAGVKKVSADFRPKRKIDLLVVWGKPGRFPDPDNLMKIFLDCLKRCFIIVDDSAEWCTWRVPTVQRAGIGRPSESYIDVTDLEIPDIDPRDNPALATFINRLTRCD